RTSADFVVRLRRAAADRRASRCRGSFKESAAIVVPSGQISDTRLMGPGQISPPPGDAPSVADGVRCAVTMAQRACRPMAGERLGLRLGLHVGEVLPDEADYVGTRMVLARRLCDRATAGQILCSGVVVELLRGPQGFTFTQVGPLALKEFTELVVGYEVV